MSTNAIILRAQTPQIVGQCWESSDCLRIGRLESLEIPLNDSSVSRLHAEVKLRGDEWVVRDLGSSNGTYLNGVRLGRTEQKLRKFDQLKCGDMTLLVEMLQSKGPEVVKASGSFMTVQAEAKRPWDKAVEELIGSEGPRQNKGLLTLLRTGYHMCNSQSMDELLQSFLTESVACFQADRSGIFLAEELTGVLSLTAVATADAIGKADRSCSRMLAQKSFRQGQSVLYQDVNDEPEKPQGAGAAHLGRSSVVCALLRSPRRLIGVFYLDRNRTGGCFTQEDLLLADSVAASLSVGIENAQLVESQRDLFLHTITALAQAVEMRDQYTGNHTSRVTTYALLLAEELGVSAEDRRILQIASPLHDIGKIAISDLVLRKESRLTEVEYEQMKTHVTKGAAILEMIPGLSSMVSIIRNHHERWDGQGYPDELAGEQIPRLARIVAVADAFDAMTSDRPYRTAMSLDAAFQELRDKAGSHFDPQCVEAFLRLQPRIERLFKQEEHYKQLAQSAEQTMSRQELADILTPKTAASLIGAH